MELHSVIHDKDNFFAESDNSFQVLEVFPHILVLFIILKKTVDMTDF